MTASPERRFALDPAVASLIRAASTARVAGARWFILAGLLYVWTDATNHVSAAISVGLQLSVFSTVARWTTRVPRSAARVDYDERALKFLAHTMGVSDPNVRLARSGRESVRVRGSSRRPVILISPKSLLVWQRDSAVHSVQLSHEMGHIWADDLGRARFLSISVLLVAAEVAAITATKQPHQYTLILLGAATALVSLRSFLRAREHAADFIAARVLGPQARNQLTTTRAPEGRLPLLLGTHPAAGQRRRAFDEPGELFAGLRLPMFAFGFACTFALDMGTAAYRILTGTASRTAPLQIVLVLTALLVLPMLGGLFATSAALASTRMNKSWMRSYLFGTLTCLFVLTGARFQSAVVVVYLAAALLLAKLIAPGPELIFVFMGDPENLGALQHRISQALLPVAAWVGLLELYYFHTLLPIVHFAARLPFLR